MILKFILPAQKNLAVHLLTTDLIKWNEADLGGADLGGGNLRGTDLGGVYLRGAYLEDANLRGAYLRGADLGSAYLRGANLRGADLGGAYLRGAFLGGAHLRGAYLRGAYLRGADLRGADLAKYIIDYGQEVRGWRRILYFDTKDCRIMAGCRYFSFDEAVKHWGSNDYPNRMIGDEYLRLIDRMKEDAKLKGWIK